MPKGIGNLGNTCYLNSMIQIVSRISPLNDIIYHTDISNQNDEIHGNVWHNWRQICMILHSSNDNNDDLYPQGLIGSMQRAAKEAKLPFFAKKSQEDFVECFLFFIDCLHKSVSKSVEVEKLR